MKTTSTFGNYAAQLGTPLLSAADEKDLARLYEAGVSASAQIAAGNAATPELLRAIRKGEEAKDRFVRSNLRLVISIAKRYPQTDGLEFDDLVSAGNIGLIRAVEKFDWTQGFKFSTYATFWIRQGIGRLLDRSTLVRIPADIERASRNANRDGTTTSDADQLLVSMSRPLSLNVVVGDDTELEGFVAERSAGPEDVALAGALSEEFAEMIRHLPDKERLAVEMRFGFLDGEKKTYRAIGQALGVSSQYASQLVTSGLGSLRSVLTAA